MNEQFFPNYLPMLWIVHASMGVGMPILIKYVYDTLKTKCL